MANTMGFGDSSKKEEVVKDVQTLIKEDIRSLEEFQDLLVRELNDLGALTANIKLLEEQMMSIAVLYKKREELLKELTVELHKGTKADLKTAKQMFNDIMSINAQLMPMVSIAHTEAQKLIVRETHRMYKKSAVIRSTMHDIDEKAKKFSAELGYINSSLNGTEEMLKGLKLIIDQKEKEREARPKKKKGKIGF